MRHRLSLALVAFCSILLSSAPLAAQLEPAGAAGAVRLDRESRMLGHYKRVLIIGAHPDDEDTELLTILVRGMGAEAAYLSLNRGEGGQNAIGAELGEALGLIRSEELLAARRLDGARQYFTRAYDFGFSKSLDETWQHWPKDSILKDVVRVVRRFRPQIVVSVFSGTPRDGHGQHQAAGWAAMEAFRAAGDSTRFPELGRDGLMPWAPLKLYRSTRFDSAATTLTIDGGVLDPAVGKSYHQIAMASRSLHRSQDMGQLQGIGPSRVRLQLVDDRTGKGSADLWAGVDTTIGDLAKGSLELADLARHEDAVRAARSRLVVDAVADDERVVPGQSLKVVLLVWNPTAAPIEVTTSISADSTFAAGVPPAERVVVAPNRLEQREVVLQTNAAASPTRPYFLEAPRAGDLYTWPQRPATVGLPFDPPLLTAMFRAEGAGQEPFVIQREVTFRYNDPAVGEIRRPITVVPRLGARVDPATLVWPTSSRAPRSFNVTLTHGARDTTSGTVRLLLPAGWPVPAPLPFRFTAEDETRTFEIRVRPPVSLSRGVFEIRAEAEDSKAATYDVGVYAVDYPHIRPRSFTRPATASVRVAPLVLPRLASVGYVRGAADRVPEALQGVGVPIALLDARTLERGDLSRYTAIVIGSRAYETEPALATNNDRLLDYARRGGLVIVQYQQYQFFTRGYAPYPMTVGGRPLRLDDATTRGAGATARPPGPPVSHDRVTDETAAVTALKSSYAVLRRPNRIVAEDWAGWIQERGLYFARSWDKAYEPVIETHDPGEAPLEGGLLIAPVGRGAYVYTGLSFFRQLPAGVPGAYRLFANLLALARSPGS